MAEMEIEVDVPSRVEDRWKEILGEGATDAVDQLSVLAERHMKDEAPEGVGIPRVNMRTTIKPRQESQNPYSKVVQPNKRVDEGWLLHHAIVDGSSNYSAPPPLEPLIQWASAKLDGDPREAAENLRWHIFQNGIPPNPFIYRSIKQWESNVEQIAQEAMDDTFEGGV